MQRKGETKTDFVKRFNKIVSEINQGTYIEKDKTTFMEILQEYVETKYQTNQVQPRTHKRDLDTIKQIEKSCEEIAYMPIQRITEYHIKKILPNITKYSNNTIDKIYRFIGKTFKIAVDERIIQYNPMESETIKKPKSVKLDKDIRALTLEEHKKLVKALESQDHKYKYILLLLLNTGMRVGEVLALSTNDIDYKANTITVSRTLTRDEHDKTIMGRTTKTLKSKRIIPMDYRIRSIVQQAQKRQISNINGLLFYDNTKDTYITPNEINCYLKRLCKKEGIIDDIHTHMLRHTYATRMIEADMQAEVLQKLLGHKKITTTIDTYTSIFEEHKQAEMQKGTEYLEAQGL